MHETTLPTVRLVCSHQAHLATVTDRSKAMHGTDRARCSRHPCTRGHMRRPSQSTRAAFTNAPSLLALQEYRHTLTSLARRSQSLRVVTLATPRDCATRRSAQRAGSSQASLCRRLSGAGFAPYVYASCYHVYDRLEPVINCDLICMCSHMSDCARASGGWRLPRPRHWSRGAEVCVPKRRATGHKEGAREGRVAYYGVIRWC